MFRVQSNYRKFNLKDISVNISKPVSQQQKRHIIGNAIVLNVCRTVINGSLCFFYGKYCTADNTSLMYEYIFCVLIFMLFLGGGGSDTVSTTTSSNSSTVRIVNVKWKHPTECYIRYYPQSNQYITEDKSENLNLSTLRFENGNKSKQ